MDRHPPDYPPAAPLHGYSTAMAEVAIERDVSCRTCGYNLRGLKPSGRCPECGSDVAPSLRGGEALWDEPRRDLYWARIGVRIIIGLLVFAILGAGFRICWFYSIFGTPFWGSARGLDIYLAPRVALVLLVLQEGAFLGIGRAGRKQLWLVLFLVMLFPIVMEIVMARLGYRNLRQPLGWGSLLAVALNFLWLRCAADIARKAQDKPLASRLRGLSWAIPCLLGLQFAMSNPRAFSLSFPIMITTVANEIALLVFNVLVVIQFVRVHVCLSKAIARAKPFGISGAARLGPGTLAGGEGLSLASRYGMGWARRVYAGLLLAIAVTAVNLMDPILWVAQLFLRTRSTLAIDRTLNGPGISMGLIRTAPAVLDLLAIWWISSPAHCVAPLGDDDAANASPSPVLRRVLRVLAVIVCLSLTLLRWAPVSRPPFKPLVLGYFALNAAATFAFYWFLEREIAICTGNQNAADQARVLKWLQPLLGVLWMGAFLDMAWLRWWDMDMWFLRGSMSLSLGLWTIWLLYLLGRPFRETLHAAGGAGSEIGADVI